MKEPPAGRTRWRIALPLLLLGFASHVLAADATLSLEAATDIARKQIARDGFPVDHLVIHLIDSPQVKYKFYSVLFDPHIPDPKKAGTFIGYEVMMDGTVKRSVVTETIRYLSSRASSAAQAPISPARVFDQPFKLQLNSARPVNPAAP